MSPEDCPINAHAMSLMKAMREEFGSKIVIEGWAIITTEGELTILAGTEDITLRIRSVARDSYILLEMYVKSSPERKFWGPVWSKEPGALVQFIKTQMVQLS